MSLTDCCFSQLPTATRSQVTCYPGNCFQGDATDLGSDSSNSSPCKNDSTGRSKRSTPDSLSPVSHSRHLYVQTRHGRSREAWLLTPPSCFTAGGDECPRVAVTDLENLLIEHPSMSVYKRSGSDGESNLSDSSGEVVVKSKRSQVTARQTPKRARAVSARAQVLAQVTQVKQAQKVQEKRSTKRNNKKGLDRLNKVSNCDKRSSNKRRVRNPSGQMNGRVPQRKQ